ncbi:MAG: replication-associated recombination protein A [Muribaculaceae bacterium]|nr:replication-associated recombination protein A [Muribaculaceae bacterium]
MNNNIPLAERMRPDTLDNYIGQRHLVGEGGIIRNMIDTGRVNSFILWGPPGVGKTTLANIVAKSIGVPFHTLSAVNSGVKEVREVLAQCERETSGLFAKGRPILFIDEIHRFNKSQQDSLLGAVERGVVTLIGATTENPSFEVIRPLLSRAQVYTLNPLDDEDLTRLFEHAIHTDPILKGREFKIEETDGMFRFAAGDARKLLNILDILEQSTPEGQPVAVNNQNISNSLQQNLLAYDKNGEMHYDIISAFIKSVRGSDPDAAVYWLARMVEGGEDPAFIARRLVILAAEDIGLANPNALLLANATFDALNKIGWPEGRIILSECTIYLATSPKSNSAYMAIDRALERVRQTGNLPVPLHLRNAPTKLMKDMGYHEGYQYAHDYANNYAPQQYLPDGVSADRYWIAGQNPAEAKMDERMQFIRRQSQNAK